MALEQQLIALIEEYKTTHTETWTKDLAVYPIEHIPHLLTQYPNSREESKELLLARRVKYAIRTNEGANNNDPAQTARLNVLRASIEKVVNPVLYQLESEALAKNPPTDFTQFSNIAASLTDQPGFPSRAQFYKDHIKALKACVTHINHLTTLMKDDTFNILDFHTRDDINAFVGEHNLYRDYPHTPLFVACNFSSVPIVKFLLTDPTIDVNQSFTKPHIISQHTITQYSSTPYVFGNPRDPFSVPYTRSANNGLYLKPPIVVPEEILTVSPEGSPLQKACEQDCKKIVELLIQHPSFKMSTEQFVTLLRKSHYFKNEIFSLLLAKVSPLSAADRLLVFNALCRASDIEKLTVFLTLHGEMELTEEQQLTLLQIISSQHNTAPNKQALYNEVLSKYPNVNLSSLLVDYNCRAFVLQQIKTENKKVGQVLGAMNQVTDKIQCKEIFKKQIQHLVLEELVALSKIMRTIQQQNISTEYLPERATVCIKNLVAMREDKILFYTRYQDTDLWLELINALKEQMNHHIQAIMAKQLTLAEPATTSKKENITACLHFFQLQSSRENSTFGTYRATQDFLQKKLGENESTQASGNQNVGNERGRELLTLN